MAATYLNDWWTDAGKATVISKKQASRHHLRQHPSQTRRPFLSERLTELILYISIIDRWFSLAHLFLSMATIPFPYRVDPNVLI